MGITAWLRRPWVKWGAEILLIIVVFVAIAAWQSRGMVKGAAPGLVGESVQGQHVDLRALRDRPVLVYFWAGWCPICKLEEGTITALAASGDYHVITVAMESGDDAAVRALMGERGVTFPAIADREGTLARQWGVSGVPASFVIDGAGEIRFREVGYTTGLGLRLRLWLADHY